MSSSAPATGRARCSPSAPARAATYPESELAQRHGAGVEQETTEPDVAYARFRKDDDVPYREGWLPG